MPVSVKVRFFVKMCDCLNHISNWDSIMVLPSNAGGNWYLANDLNIASSVGGGGASSSMPPIMIVARPQEF